MRVKGPTTITQASLNHLNVAAFLGWNCGSLKTAATPREAGITVYYGVTQLLLHKFKL